MRSISAWKRLSDFTRLLFRKLRDKDRNLSIGKGASVPVGSIVASETTIGDYTGIIGPVVIKGDDRVQIGKYCAIGDELRIISSNHQMSHANVQISLHERFGFQSLVARKRPIIVGNNVWIGDRVTVLPGVHIGDGVVIGACSVVTKDVPAFSVVVGVPARVVKKRFPQDVIDELMRIRWWDWPRNKIRRNQRFFEADLRDISVEELRNLIK